MPKESRHERCARLGPRVDAHPGSGNLLLRPARRFRSGRRHALRFHDGRQIPQYRDERDRAGVGWQRNLACPRRRRSPAAFPLAFAIIVPALYFPIVVMLLALVFRGVAFEFRFRDAERRTFWDHGFCLRLGRRDRCTRCHAGRFHPGLPGRRARFRRHGVRFPDTVFPVRPGLRWSSATGCSGAGWLVLKTEGEIQEHARRYRRVCLAGVLLALLLVSVWTPLMSEQISRRWFSWPNILLLSPVPIATALVGIRHVACALRQVSIRRPSSARSGSVALSFAGIAISLWPMIVPHHTC